MVVARVVDGMLPLMSRVTSAVTTLIGSPAVSSVRVNRISALGSQYVQWMSRSVTEAERTFVAEGAAEVFRMFVEIGTDEGAAVPFGRSSASNATVHTRPARGRCSSGILWGVTLRRLMRPSSHDAVRTRPPPGDDDPEVRHVRLPQFAEEFLLGIGEVRVSG